MDQEELKREWLTNNALLSFVGALLMGQAWQMSEGTVKIFIIFTVPDFTEYVVLAIIAVLFLLSIFLALAALVKRFQKYAFRLSLFFSLIIEVLVWFAFTLSWLSLIPELPLDQWWSLVLLLGGFMFSLIIIPTRFIQSKLRRRQTLPRHS